MVINHLEKLFVTNDAATIIRELEVEHPAAKMMILGSQMMEQEVSNGQLTLYGVHGICGQRREGHIYLYLFLH